MALFHSQMQHQMIIYMNPLLPPPYICSGQYFQILVTFLKKKQIILEISCESDNQWMEFHETYTEYIHDYGVIMHVEFHQGVISYRVVIAL